PERLLRGGFPRGHLTDRGREPTHCHRRRPPTGRRPRRSSAMLDRSTVDSLFPADLPEPAYWEQRYPPRELPPGAKVTRIGPSPTGAAHMGLVYIAMINRDIARASGG